MTNTNLKTTLLSIIVILFSSCSFFDSTDGGSGPEIISSNESSQLSSDESQSSYESSQLSSTPIQNSSVENVSTTTESSLSEISSSELLNHAVITNTLPLQMIADDTLFFSGSITANSEITGIDALPTSTDSNVTNSLIWSWAIDPAFLNDLTNIDFTHTVTFEETGFALITTPCACNGDYTVTVEITYEEANLKSYDSLPLVISNGIDCSVTVDCF